MNIPINIDAVKQRHSTIDFTEGVYQQSKKEYQLLVWKFYKNFLGTITVFFVLFLVSLNIFAYSSLRDISFIPPQETDVFSQTFVLGNNGFVLKPSLQTEKGDRSTTHQIITYTVESGDTLSSIASRFSISVNTIIDNNSGISEHSVLSVGKALTILPVNGLLVIPSSKDTISSLAKMYNIAVNDIIRQNELQEGENITGKSLILPGARKRSVVIGRAPQIAPTVYHGEVSEDFIWPANGSITQYFHRWHYALDIANRERGPIFASANGIITKASSGWNGGYGNVIIIDHGNGFQTLYAHNEKIYVKVGDSVTQGQTIGWMGNSGRVRGVTGIHLHFEIIQNGVKRNPLVYIGSQ
jgi:murein DD-endopeptidase MepM/ murein hydrolase activator NlpD